MKTFALTLCIALSGCVNPEKGTTVQPTAKNFEITSRKPFQPEGQTETEKESEDQKMLVYYGGLVESIRTLDDGSTSPDIIGRAAVTENAAALRSFKAASIAHLNRRFPDQAYRGERLINQLPQQANFDEATMLVLKHRKGTLKWPKSPKEA